MPLGTEREVLVKQRVNQSFFRSVVLSSYNFRCCISGVCAPQLLEACHIVDWSQDVANRTNPKNGLCLNPFFHKAYDEYLIGISPDFKIAISEELLDKTENTLFFRDYLRNINSRNIIMPDRFLPQRELLEIQYNNFKSRT